MRIGHYMHGLWSAGGIASYLVRVSEAQAARGHEVLFFDSNPDPGERAAFVGNGTELVAAAIRSRLDVLHLHLDPPGGLPSGVPSVRTVHGHQPYCPSGSQYLSGSGVACERRHGYLACGWGHVVDRCGSRRPSRLVDDFRRTRAEQRSAQNTLLLAISEFVRSRLLRDGYEASRIRVLPNPGPTQRPVAPVEGGGPPRFLFMGRITREKGLARLVAALCRTTSDVVLDAAGSGPEEQAVRAMIRAEGLSSLVVMHDWADQDSVASLIAGARAVIVPSLWHEPAGMVAIEAAVHGRATIASAVGGLPEIVLDGVTGLLVPPGDIDALARSIDRLAGDPAEATAMGAAARERGAILYSLDGHVDRLLAVYSEVSA